MRLSLTHTVTMHGSIQQAALSGQDGFVHIEQPVGTRWECDVHRFAHWQLLAAGSRCLGINQLLRVSVSLNGDIAVITVHGAENRVVSFDRRNPLPLPRSRAFSISHGTGPRISNQILTKSRNQLQ